MARILIADDSRPIRMLLHRALSLDGHAVLEAENGDAALACLIDERPDVAILDVIMPGLSGIDVCRAARADPKLDEIGLIFLTGDASSEQVRTAGADFTFTKPFSPHALLAAIAEIAPPAEPDGTDAPSETRSRLLARRRRSRTLAVR